MDIDIGSTEVHRLFALSEDLTVFFMLQKKQSNSFLTYSVLVHHLLLALSEARLDDLDSDICEASHLVRNV